MTRGRPELLPSSKRVKEDPGNYSPVSHTSITGKTMEQIILKVITKEIKEKTIRSSRHGFTKSKLCLPTLTDFCDGIAGWVEDGRAVSVVYLHCLP